MPFIIHRGADENVPVWHTRELVAAYKTWNSPENITYGISKDSRVVVTDFNQVIWKIREEVIGTPSFSTDLKSISLLHGRCLGWENQRHCQIRSH